MKGIFLFFVVLFLGLPSHSQNQYKKWYFGNMAGLDFMTAPPTPLVNSAMLANEGCASVSDANGNLLFYTNGETVWNKNHVMMANGSNIGGNITTTESALILPVPSSASLYYIFTMGYTAAIGLGYAIVDMSLAAGMGSVTIKNPVPIAGFTTSEKLTGTRHCNGTDYWIVTHGSKNKIFYAFLFSSAGLNTTPVMSIVGQDTISGYGYMKISPNGKRIAFTGRHNNCLIHDFDNATGIVGTNSLSLTNTVTIQSGGFYGVEFSQDGSKIYTSDCSVNTSGPYNLYQWDLCAGNDQAVLASRTLLYSEVASANLYGGALQLAPNGKIYRTRAYADTMGVINNPNMAGSACNYVHSGQAISPKANVFGIPNFVNSLMNPLPAQFVYSAVCHTVSFNAFGTPTCAAVNYPVLNNTWSFGDPASGTNNTSSILNPSHVYQAGGTYTTQLVLNYACRADTLRQVITIPTTMPTFSLNGKPAICKNQTTTLSAVGSASQGVLSYSWSPLNSTSTLVSVSPTVTTVYTVTGTDLSGCSVTQTLQLAVSPCLGIDEQRPDNIANIYPNPNDGSFYIESATNLSFSIYNQLGEFVSGGKAIPGKQAVDLSHLANGIYFMKLSDGKDEKMLKLVKGE